MREAPRIRLGSGFDIHRAVGHARLVLGGVEIPAGFGLESETDGDVVLHCVIDAVLAAAGLPDIGVQFPPGGNLFAGMPSSELAARALKLAKAAGLELEQLDVTILAEAPQLSPHYGAIRASLARLFSLEVSCISVKARSLEGLGDIGEGRAVAAYALALGKLSARGKKTGAKIAAGRLAREHTGDMPKGAIIVSIDGGSRGNPGQAAAAAVVSDPEGTTYSQAERLGIATNNVAEYKGVLLALRLLAERNANEREIILRTDSSLIYYQLLGAYKVNDETLRELASQALSEMESFPNLRLMLIPREQNKQADAEVNAALDAQPKQSS